MAPHIETEVLKVHVAVDWRRKRLSVCGSTRVAKRVPGIILSCKVIVDRISEDASSCDKSHSRNQCSPECSFSFHHFGVLHFGLQTRGKEVQVAGLESPNDLGATRRVARLAEFQILRWRSSQIIRRPDSSVLAPLGKTRIC